jgi:hypothetical protein
VAVLRNEAMCSNYKISNKKCRSKWQQVLVRNTKSEEMIKSMHGSLAKPCTVLIISVDLVFPTRTHCHFLCLKSDEIASNQMKTCVGICVL